MILWNDFILDDAIGPVLLLGSIEQLTGNREKEEAVLRVMEDAREYLIQETRQRQQPARMVGLSSLEGVLESREADETCATSSQRRREGAG